MNSSEIRAKAREILSGNWPQAILLAFVYLVVNLLLTLVTEFFYNNFVVYNIATIIIAIISYPISYGILSTFMKLKNKDNFTYFSFFKDGFSNFVKLYKILLSTVVKLILPILLTIIGFIFVFTSLITFIGALSSNEEINSLYKEIETIESTASSSDATETLDIANEILNLEAEITNISTEVLNSLPTYILLLLLIGGTLLLISSIWLTVRSLYYSLTSMIFFENNDMKSRDIVMKSRELMNKKRWKYFVLNLSFIGWYLVIAIISASISNLLGTTIANYISPFFSAFLFPYIMISNIVFYDYTKESINTISE